MQEPVNDISWDDFRLIKAIADARGLYGAAAQLGLNHSTVFRHLGQVEKAVGTNLFARHRSGYTLTQVGEEMVELATRLNDDVSRFNRKVAGRTTSRAGELRVAANSLLIRFLTPLFARFQLNCPEVRLRIVLSNRPLDLSGPDADVAIRAADDPPESLVGRRIARIAWAPYGRAVDFSGARPPPASDLLERPWVSLDDNSVSRKAINFIRQYVAPERIVYKINSVLDLAQAVESGVGVGLLPCFIGDLQPTLIRLAPPDSELAADLWLLTHAELRHCVRVRVFLDYLSGEIGKLRPILEGTVTHLEGLAGETRSVLSATQNN